MNVLAIDPANRFGFYHTDGYFGSESIDRYGDHPGQRLLRFSKWIRDTLKNHKTDLIAAEDASFGSHNPSVQASHNELLGIIKLVAAESNIEVRLFNPMTIKVFATGSGRADKKQMMRAAKTHYGLEIHDDNVADALFIRELASRPDCWAPENPKKAKRRGKILPPTKRYKRLF